MIGVAKIKARYKSYESRRQLLAEHEVFLADDRIITLLPKILGKVFYNHSSKRPIPVDFQPPKFIRKEYMSSKTHLIQQSHHPSSNSAASVGSPWYIAHEIERALSCAQVYLSPSVTSSVRVGLSSFTPEQLTENVETVVDGIVERFVTKKWRNVRSIHIKGPNTMALPVWLADRLWIDEEDVLSEEEAKQRAGNANHRGTKSINKKGNFESESKAVIDDSGKKIRKAIDGEFSKEMKERREKLREQKEELRMVMVEGKTPKSEGGDQVVTGAKKRKVENGEKTETAGRKRRRRSKRQQPGDGDAVDSGAREAKSAGDVNTETRRKSRRSEVGHEAEMEGTKQRQDGTGVEKESKRTKNISLAG